MTQQALLLDQTSECSCASATSCCVCGHANDEASLTTCATCMMNYHKECVEAFVQYVVAWARYQAYIANVLLCRQLFSKERFVKCVWQRTCPTMLARDHCRPCPQLMQFRISVGKMQQERLKTVENHLRFSIFFFSILILTQRLKLSDKEKQNVPDAPDG